MNQIQLKRTKQCWQDMKQRCYNKNSRGFKYYGGRGISVCNRWLESFQNFLEDMGEKPDGFSIDRINVNGNYEPSNCKWATPKEQRDNRRDIRLIEFNVMSMSLRDWSKFLDRHETTLNTRLKHSYPINLLLSPDRLLFGGVSAPKAMEAEHD